MANKIVNILIYKCGIILLLTIACSALSQQLDHTEYNTTYY